MPVVPKSLVTLGASLLAGRAAARLRRDTKGDTAQARVFAGLTPNLAAGSFWAHAGVEPRMSLDKFRERVPLQTYEDLAPCIGRMKKGEPDVLWPGPCQLYAASSGTTDGRTKHIPVTEAMLDHFKRTALASLLWYTARARSSGVFRGRHLFLGGSAALARIPESGPFEAYCGDMSGIAALNLPKWAERHYYEPGTAIAQIADWPAKIDAIVERTSKVDLTLLAGIPNWVLGLAEALRAKAPGSPRRLQDLWPRLECLVHGGVPVAPFQDELHEVLGSGVRFHEVYPASEAFIAAQDADPTAGLRLMVDAGVFFEFLPMADFNEDALPGCGPKALPLWGVRPGVDYALILTTPAGLARYVVGDVVRFVSTEPPRIIYVGRTKLHLSAFGEHVIEKEITDALLAVCRRSGWSIVNFHVAPLFASSTTGRTRGRHEWWVELKAGTHLTPTGPIMALELDAELKRLNDDYGAKRSGGGLEAPYVRLVQPGVFETWMRQHGKWGGQNKMPRCRSDRLIADELGKALQFAKD
jgi:hypothetical protein